jgi:hypothetical protein
VLSGNLVFGEMLIMSDEDQVKLKPILNIRPGVYLACLYGAILLLVLFFVLLYPGISNPGSVIVVKSEPWGAAVLIDGVYMDVAPCEIFVSAGHRRIELRLPGFVPKQIDKDIGGKLFASALFPLKIEIHETLEASEPALAFVNEAAEYVAWTFAGEPSAAYQIPLSLSEGAYRLGPAASDPALRESMEGVIAASASFAVTRASLRDILRAKTLLDNHGLSPSPLSLLSSAQDMIGFLDGNPAAALWLGTVLTGDTESVLTASFWYTEAAAKRQDTTAPQAKDTQTIRAGLLNFRLIRGGPISGGNFPAGTMVDTFYISETVISRPAWERFLEQRPRWRRENAEVLLREGLIREGYLEAVIFPGAPAEGVSGISWYAARAYCEWLSELLPPQYASWEVRLPTEAEWEYAAKAGALDSVGRFWEWCENPFVPLSFLSAPPAAARALGSPERPLKGGSWVNPTGSVGSETRGSLPPSFCSPFVSFRPVIAPKGSRP